ncbi:MAG: SCO family protein [Trueperaceae bacterium]
MKRTWLYGLIALLVITGGIAAYSLGRILGTNTASPLSGTEFQQPVDISNIRLQTPRGDFQFSALQDKVVVVFFGFVRCPDVCPLTMTRLAEIYRNIGEPEDLKIVMITVDPENDTPEVTQQYAAAFHSTFLGLSGSNEQIAEATQRFYIGTNITQDGQVIHTDPLIILDRTGAMRRVYSQTSLPSLEQDLPRLLELF